MNNKLLNPYDFLGLTIDSSIKDLKKKYFELALICHPDKGGNKDDMDILNKAYKYIYEQLNVIDNNKSFESLEENFNKFCQEQENVTCPFSNIYNDFRNEFNYEFDKNRDDKNESFWQGYGDFMIESNIDSTNYNIKVDDTVPIEIPKYQIIEYKSPQAFNSDIFENNKKIKDNGKIKDFSIENGMDYLRAFSQNNISSNDEIPSKSLEEIIKERENLDNYLINSKNN